MVRLLIPFILANQAEELFLQLLFGYGSPFLFLMCAVLMVLVVLKSDVTLFLFVPFSVIMGFILVLNIDLAVDVTWGIFVTFLWFVLPIFLIGISRFGKD